MVLDLSPVAVIQLLICWIFFKENYRLIARRLIVIDLNKQSKLKDPQKINCIAKLKELNNRETMFFIIEKLEETTFELFQDS